MQEELLCDEDPKLRELAAAHPAMPAESFAQLRRAGASEDLHRLLPGGPSG